MIEFESTIDGPESSRQSTICVVYDERDGRVVHVHEFIGDGTGLFGKEGEAERAQMALATARQHSEPSVLRTLHAPREFRLEEERVYRVDLGARTLVAREPKRPPMREIIEHRLKRRAKEQP
jgi:hypothetical protein